MGILAGGDFRRKYNPNHLTEVDGKRTKIDRRETRIYVRVSLIYGEKIGGVLRHPPYECFVTCDTFRGKTDKNRIRSIRQKSRRQTPRRAQLVFWLAKTYIVSF